MLKFFSLHFILLLALCCSLQPAVAADNPGYNVITSDELKALTDTKRTDLLIVDTRNPEEYQEIHIKGAVSIPQKNFPESAHLLPADKDAQIILYCNGVKCGKSKKAAALAREMGYANIWVYAEGMPVWEERGFPIVAGPDYEKKIETTVIPPRELDVLLKSGTKTFTVVDVRDAKEYAQGHIPGAINIPAADFAAQSDQLDKEKKIIVYCNSGGRSYNAYRKLIKLAYKDIAQAIFADWQAAGLPVAN